MVPKRDQNRRFWPVKCKMALGSRSSLTNDNVADFFTKPLSPDMFLRFRRFLMNE